ncbi:MAG: lipopolysaccharide assembly protein LapA domain-containing protein [Desulfovibrionaceae bacterium]
MRNLRTFFIVAVFVLFALFFAQNYETLTMGVQLLFNPFITSPYFTPVIPLYALLLLTFLLGVIFISVFSIRDKFSMQSKIRKLEKRIIEQDKELQSLRELPVHNVVHYYDKEPSLSNTSE